MEKEKTVIVGLIIILIFLAGLFYFFEFRIIDYASCRAAGYPSLESYPAQCNTFLGKHFVQIIDGNNPLIGGDRDEHGCLGPAGYSWNETERECVREWETGEGRYQVSSFQSCKDAGYSIMESYPRQCQTPSGRRFVEAGDNLDEYFREQMWERGVENLGAHPVEGFDPSLFIGAYPGLKEEDFDGAGAIGGRWELEGNSLLFIRENDDVITSADGTLNENGMKTLLRNLEKRFGEIESANDVDNLIDKISEDISKFEGGLILMQNSKNGEYSCFGCGKSMCIDPAPIMKMVQETNGRYCDLDFNVIETEGETEKLRFCPDEWISNQMPGVTETNSLREYFIVDGERRELNEFDVDFVDKYCEIEKKIVY